MKKTKLFIVEDEVIIAKSLQNKLQGLGYEVLGNARSGEAALQMLTNTSLPELVLMDIQLAGTMDGVETAQQVRERFGIPVLFLTAYSDEVTLERAKITEPFGYIIKPFNTRELYANIEMALYKHQAERQRKTQERLFATTLKCLGDAVITTDTAGLVTYMNPVAETLTGWNQAEAVGGPVTELFSLKDPDSSLPLESPLVQILEKAGPTELNDHKVTLVTKDGVERLIDYRANRITDEKQTLLGAVLACQDVTNYHHAEQILLDSQKLVSLGTLAAGIAHEINSPLQVITGLSQSLLTRLDRQKLEEEHLRGKLDVIQRNGWRCAEIVRALRTYGHSAGSDLEPNDLNTIVQDTLLLIEHQLHRWHNVEIITDLASDLPELQCNRNQISQIIINLLTNARDAMPEGGEITIRTDLTPEPRRLSLRVEDTGSGIPEAVRSKIFDPFFTTKPVGVGTGLGLSIISGIVKAHGGQLQADNRQPKGTVFTITF